MQKKYYVLKLQNDDKIYIGTKEELKNLVSGENLESAEFICFEECNLTEHFWRYINIWGNSYEMKCDSAQVKQIIVKYEGKYLKCVKTSFKNLNVLSKEMEWKEVSSISESVIDVKKQGEDIVTSNLLYTVEEIYDNLDDAKTDICNNERISFMSFCDELFGDE